MGFAEDRRRWTGRIEGYAAGRHDRDKRYLARMCLLSLPLTQSYGELHSVFSAYHTELLRLVGGKNARRWFSHKAGALEAILREARDACVVPAENELRLVRGRAPNLATTLLDWGRHGGGETYQVNGRRFTIDAPDEEALRAFFVEAGITNATLRDYLCAHASQAGLITAGAQFQAAMGGMGIAVAANGRHRHRYTTVRPHQMSVYSAYEYNVLLGGGDPVMLDPPLTLVCEYTLSESDGAVEIRDRRFQLENLDSVPEAHRSAVDRGLLEVEIPDLG